MFQSIEDSVPSLFERFRQRFGRRLPGMVLALLFEAMVLFLIYSIGQSISERETPAATMTTFDISPVPAADHDPPQAAAEPDPGQPTEPQPAPPPSQPAPPPPERRRDQPPAARVPPAIIPISPNEMDSSDIAELPSPRAAPTRRGPMGPAAPAAPADTPRAGGTGPDGQPLYAAAWYREPTDDQLRGYLSTADGPGYALIACRTVADYRVEDCVQLSEYPRNSHIGRSVLAAAWQFRVIPPRIGGQTQVGAWVRIRIDYNIRRR